MAVTICKALFLAAPASGQGKTTITAALARMLRNQGKVVRIFKTGPDYLDPQILHQASGNPVEPVDMWLAGDAYCQQRLFLAAQHADVILIEGAMGLYDGEPSSADIAVRFNIPLALVMDVKGMAQTAAALAMGLANFHEDLNVMGLIANNCGSPRHAQLIRDALPESLSILAALKRNADISLPERHLGLVQAEEVQEELEQCFEKGVEWLKEGGIDALLEKLSEVEFESAELPIVKPLLQDKVIAIAKDRAFSFIYQANLDCLQDLGAQLNFFSPLANEAVPENATALWLPGGYPELYTEQLSKNEISLQSIRDFHAADKPIVAECGGFMYCLQEMRDMDDQHFPVLALLQGYSQMVGRSGCQGMQAAVFPEGELRAHAHHRSRSFETPEPIGYGRRQRSPAPGESIYREGKLTASYLHLFFASEPVVTAKLFT